MLGIRHFPAYVVVGDPYEPPPPPPPPDIAADAAAALAIGSELGELDLSGDLSDEALAIGDTISVVMRTQLLSVNPAAAALAIGDTVSAFLDRIVVDVEVVGGLKIGSSISVERRGNLALSRADGLRILDSPSARLVFHVAANDLDAYGLLIGDSVSVRIRVPVPDTLARSAQGGGAGTSVVTNRPVSKQGQGDRDHELASSLQGAGDGSEVRDSVASSKQGQGGADVS